jgi:hypothetical protein
VPERPSEDFPFVICHFSFVIGEFNLEAQQNIVAGRPIWGEMFIERAIAKRFVLAPAERNLGSVSRTITGNIALRWSASCRLHSIVYKHLAPLERNEFHWCTSKFNSPMTNAKWKMTNGKSFRWSSVQSWHPVFGFVLILLLAASTFGQENKCSLKLADLPAAPELFGFHLGMTAEQAKLRVPQIMFGRVDHFGVTKTSINPDFDQKIDKASLEGVRTVSLDFLDGRLTSLWFGFDSTFKWTTVPDFIGGISQSLHLPDAWKTWRIRGQQLNCADFQMTVTLVAGAPSFHIIDDTAEQTIASRREAKEEQDAAAEEAAGEIVADKKDKLYYLEGCLPANEIKEEDRVTFKSKEEAEKAGFKPAKNCQ